MYPLGYKMFEVRRTERFARWFSGLRDSNARRRIQARIDLLELGNPGDCKAIGSGVSEMRIRYGPGFRVYFMRRGQQVFLLLAGGDKRTQSRDIAAAVEMAKSERS
jgi:putative addiction module killer protein